MKTGKLGRMILAGTAVLGTLFLAKAATWVAGSFNPPVFLQSVTNLTLFTNTGPAVQVVPNTGMTLTVTSAGNSSNAMPMITGWDVSPDGTNWTTTEPFKLTNTLAGTGVPTTGLLQLTPSNLLDVQWIRETYVSTTSQTAVTNTWSGWAFWQ